MMKGGVVYKSAALSAAICSERIARSSPASVSGNIRSSTSSRVMRIEGVYSQRSCGSGLSQAWRGKLASSRFIQAAPGSSFQCSMLPPGCRIS